jgi:hypothetical protein
MMQLRYGDATEHFRLAQQRLAPLSAAAPDVAEAQPAKPGHGSGIAVAAGPAAVDIRQTAETKPPFPLLDVAFPAARAESVQSVSRIQAGRAIAAIAISDSAAISAGPAKGEHLAAVTPVGPPGLAERRPSLPPAGADAKTTPSSIAMSAETLALLLRRGDELIALGDVSSARLLYKRAAAGGDARAATGVGKTYDPLFLSAIGARGIQPDPQAAAAWYRKAIDLGDHSATERLTRISQSSIR